MLLFGFLLTRIPLVIAVEALNWSENAYFALGLELLIFPLALGMIGVGLAHLSHFRVDRIALALFILFGFPSRITNQEISDSSLELLSSGIALLMLAALSLILRAARARQSWAAVNWNWTTFAVWAAAILRVFLLVLGATVEGMPIALLPNRAMNIPRILGLGIAFLGAGVAAEEIAFRGFLWGYLEQRGWDPIRIWLSQAGLFWIAHLRHLSQPVVFWVGLSLVGLLLGWLSLESKSITPSLVVHVTYNLFGFFF